METEEEMLKSSGKKDRGEGGRLRGSYSQGRTAIDICSKTFPGCPVLCWSICKASMSYITQLIAVIDKQKHEAAIWGELCNLRNVLVVLYSLNPDLAFTNQIIERDGKVPSVMFIDCMTNMILTLLFLHYVGRNDLKIHNFMQNKTKG